ncbi:MAG: hypothetical protein AAFP82_05970 [Bacteroidota bacterium]
MARVKLSDDLKHAISGLPSKEKDKLLFRLIAKDEALVEKLIFELLERDVSPKDRRETLMEEIDHHLDQYKNYYYSPGYLLLELRSISGIITRHVKTTKDKYGDIQLNFFMLNKSLALFGERIQQARPQKQRTLSDYVIKRAVKLLKQLSKMHPDLRLDFEQDMMLLGKHISKNRLMVELAPSHGLNLSNLLEGHLGRNFNI